MKEIQFKAYGHPNISAAHRTTLEFTKERFLTKKGTCIIGVNADFNEKDIKRLITNLKENKIDKIEITITVNKNKEIIIAKPNLGFSDKKEMVIRKTDFLSPRTFATDSSKAAIDINNNIKQNLKRNNTTILVTIEPKY